MKGLFIAPVSLVSPFTSHGNACALYLGPSLLSLQKALTMGFIVKVLLTAVAALVAAYLLPGVTIDGIASALLVALILSILNSVVKPILVVLTIPITIVTLGLFLLVINAILVFVTDFFVSGFAVSGLLTAILFSLIVSVVRYILDAIVD